ncbi:MAG: 23S rRNA (uracil(1939)-C(5))-methyltransferase RlmD [Clostridiales bacterium]|nr:23S rRNA (uracil(1939)-C(5))-methyltransferase RlmD [Clostridiales bacterium]
MTVFVRGAFVGDEILAHIIKVKSSYAVGIIKEFIVKSGSRIESRCPVAEKCGGCCFAQIDYNAELEIKQRQVADNFKRIGGLDVEVDPIIPSPSAERYRNKAQYPVGKVNGSVAIGFYAPMSHRIIDCTDCILQPEEFREITEIFRKWITDNNIEVYDEESHKGLLRHIYIRKAAAGEQLLVCVVANASNLPFADELVSALSAVKNIVGVVLNINREKTNVVLGRKDKMLYGKNYIVDRLCGLEFKISPHSFYQVNHDCAEVLYGKAKEYAALTGKETIVDLYCGTGTIGLTMADKSKKLIGVEIVPQAIENAVENAGMNGITNAEFICGDASKAAEELSERGIKADVVILDPPRKGCDEELLTTLARMSPDRIVYVSCDSATLARDCKRLAQMNYAIHKVTPVDMFPRTGNVETVALLSRDKA